MKRARMIGCVLTGCFFYSGCALAPKYTRPKAPVAPAWTAGQSGAQASATSSKSEAPDLKWQDFFDDEKLRRVIELAVQNNRDLRVAALNVEKVQALYRIQRAQQFPAVDASAAGQVYRLPGEMSVTGRPQNAEKHAWNVGVTAWELDFFGRVRSLKDQALEQFLASEQARYATRITLIAAVASTYLTFAADQESLRLAQATFEAQKASYELIVRRREWGLASDLDVRQAQSQVEAARVDIARYTSQIALDRNALELLCGTAVPADWLPEFLGPESMLRDVAPGTPSDTLLRRPDILMAEHRLKAAYANIGAARAAFFPRIALTTGGGLMSSDLAALFQAGSRTWNFAPQTVAPVFDSGARKASVKAAEADRDIAVAEYEKAIQSAFREVSDALALRAKLVEQLDAQQALVKTLDEAYRLSQARYKAGIDSYLGVLVAQRSLYAAQQALVSLRLAHLSNLVTLYKALGGGA